MVYRSNCNGYPHQGSSDPSFSQQARFLQPNHIHKNGQVSQNNRHGAPYRYPNNKTHNNNSYHSHNHNNQNHQNQNRAHGNQNMSHQGNAGQNRESGYSANRGYRGKSNNYNASYSRHGGDHPGSTNRSGQHFDQHGPRRGANQDPSSHLSQSQRNQHYEPGSNAQNPSNFIRGNFSQDRHHNLQYSGSHAPSTGGQYQISQYDGQVDAGFRGRSSRFDRAGNDLSNDHFGDQAIVYLSVPPEWGANTVSNIDRDGDTVMENGSDSNVWASYNISRYSHLMG